MPLKLNSTGGGSVTVDVPSTASNYTATLPATTGTVVLSDVSNNVSVTNLTASGNVTAGGTVVMSSPFAMRNKIINGAMEIDQRNAGASVSITSGGQYTLDRWNIFASQSSKMTVQQNAGSVTPPTGYSNYIGVTSSSAYSVGASESFSIRQYIEAFNITDLAFGTASAKTVTLSFWVRSSLTGSFGGCLYNGPATQFYPFTYTISSANTWEQKSITIAGETTGTWYAGTNGLGLAVQFSLGAGASRSGTAGAWTASAIVQPTGSTSVVGTNGATFYLTGVQLEVGSVATPFERRLYSQEFAMCQRYYQLIYAMVGTPANSTTQFFTSVQYPVVLRATPTLSLTGTINITDPNLAGYTQSSAGLTIVGGQNSRGSFIRLDNFSGMNNYRFLMTNDFGNALVVSAEL